MIKRIFSSILLVSTSVLLVGLIFIMAILYQHFSGQLEKELRNQATYLAVAVEAQGVQALEQLPKEAERITLIAQDGTVLFDNEAESGSMGNHSDREEIIQAQESGSGFAVRQSDTLGQSTTYYALRLSDGKVLRVSSTQYSVWVLILNLLQPVAWVVIAMLILAGVFAARASKKIVEPLNQLDLEHPDVNKVYDEVEPLLFKIQHQQVIIRRQLAEAKRQQEDFVFITEHMSEGLLLIDADAKLLAFNNSALQLLNAHDIKNGQNILNLNRSEQFFRIVEAVLSNQHQSEILKLGDISCQVTANPVLRDEKVAGAVLLLTDVTEAVQRETLRREFTANVSHELKTPLTSISGFAELMKSGMAKPEDTKQFAERIFKESRRLITLVNDIIKISQLDEGSLPCVKEPADLAVLVQDVLDRLQPAAEQAGVALRLEANGPVIIDTMAPILEEVLFNLCDNAIKYNRPGGSVIVRLEDSESQLSVAVSDTGIGIPPADRQRVFERFYRADKSHSQEIGGTGLGLAIVKHGAAYLGAEIRLESVVGAGSTFTLVWHKDIHQTDQQGEE